MEDRSFVQGNGVRGFYLEIGGAKRYVFHAPAAAEDLQVILNALPKQ